MPNQCRNCGRDVNNNYAPYQNAYATSGAPSGKQQQQDARNGSTTGQQQQVTAKVMFGTVGAIKELREKEQAEKNAAASGARGTSGRRQ